MSRCPGGYPSEGRRPQKTPEALQYDLLSLRIFSAPTVSIRSISAAEVKTLFTGVHGTLLHIIRTFFDRLQTLFSFWTSACMLKLISFYLERCTSTSRCIVRGALLNSFLLVHNDIERRRHDDDGANNRQ